MSTWGNRPSGPAQRRHLPKERHLTGGADTETMLTAFEHQGLTESGTEVKPYSAHSSEPLTVLLSLKSCGLSINLL